MRQNEYLWSKGLRRGDENGSQSLTGAITGAAVFSNGMPVPKNAEIIDIFQRQHTKTLTISMKKLLPNIFSKTMKSLSTSVTLDDFCT